MENYFNALNANSKEERLSALKALIKEQKELILKQIEEYKLYLKEIEFKEWYYETAIKNGTEKGMDEIVCNKATLEIDKIPKNKEEGK